MIEALDRRVQGWVEEGRIVGAELLVIKNHRSVLHRAFGWKDREQRQAMEPNTIFNIRSMTKPLVGMATQILIEEGALALEDRVAEFLPAFRHGNAAKITVEHLLTHQGGLPVSLAFDPENQSNTLQELAEAIGAVGPEFEPGTRFWYSDAGADVLAALVENVSGQSLETFIRSRLFGPLGMREAGFLTQVSGRDLPTSRTAVLYGGTAGAWQRFWEPSEDPFYPFPLGSQSIYTTPIDYARFLTLWLDGGSRLGTNLLSEESIRRTLTPVSPMTQIGSTAPYPTAFRGLEVWHGQMALLYRDADGAGGASTRALGYAGSDGTFAWVWPREDLMVLFFTQSRGQDVHMELEATLHDLLLEPNALGEAQASPPTGSPEAALPPIPDPLRRYLGRYLADFGPYQGAEFTVLVQGGVLAVDIPGQMVFTLNEPDEEGWRSFTLTDLIAVFFQEGASGEVEAMRLAQTYVFPKQPSPLEALEDIPDSIRPLLGVYELPAGQGVLTVTWESGTLTVTDPRSMVTPLAETDESGGWETDEHPPKHISFTRDTEGNIEAMKLIEIVDLPRVGPGA